MNATALFAAVACLGVLVRIGVLAVILLVSVVGLIPSHLLAGIGR